MLAGYPVVDVKVAIVDGTFHEVDSSELAFKMAGIFALKEAAKKANPILLEPIMKVEVTTPDEYQGDLLGDLNRRRGKIVHIEAKDASTIVTAEVPLAEMFGYATAIRSLSKGRAALFDGAVPVRAGAQQHCRRHPGRRERQARRSRLKRSCASLSNCLRERIGRSPGLPGEVARERRKAKTRVAAGRFREERLVSNLRGS